MLRSEFLDELFHTPLVVAVQLVVQGILVSSFFVIPAQLPREQEVLILLLPILCAQLRVQVVNVFGQPIGTIKGARSFLLLRELHVVVDGPGFLV